MMIKLSELFHVEYGNQIDLNKLEKTTSKYGVRFISRSSENLGFQCYVKPNKNYKLYKKGDITITLGGTYLLSAFVQPGNFYTAQNIKILIPKNEMSDAHKYFYCYAITLNRFRYTSHGREANKTINNLLLPSPSEMPIWVGKELKLREPVKTPYHIKQVELSDRKWELIEINKVFNRLYKCRCSNATQLLELGEDIFYIGAKKSDNGLMQKVARIDNLVSKGNCIVFIGDGQGSVGLTTYQENDFIGSSTLTCGYSSNLNKFNALFLVTVLDLERYRYSFGRKYGREQARKSKIKLPVTKDGNPDWQFMEYYIKSLPYSSNLEEKPKSKGLDDQELIEKYESGSINLGKKLKPILK